MAVQITDETMEYVEILAKLKLSEEERKAMQKAMQTMLDYVAILQDVKTEEESAEPDTVLAEEPLYNVFREDVVTEYAHPEDMLSNAPRKKDGQYQVPRTIG
ncbi:MAG TPA: Asp-tRNA(Asn)/Glu-tRNA(Gln) amidotransferase GatCAB subunit C [Lachnospiraceae bacterium]|nr:Asp-tRNA(Asn)/Glu-tRNA(Gln) amidotransferase GatCAB subunit C [Lachnospiraceae bacterium]